MPVNQFFIKVGYAWLLLSKYLNLFDGVRLKLLNQVSWEKWIVFDLPDGRQAQRTNFKHTLS